MIGETISHYHILEKLGEGGMGVVYKARDIRLGRLAALKFLPRDLTLDAEAKHRLIHEAQAASRLDHPSICTVYEIDETDDGQVFISLAYCGGQSVADRLTQGPMDLRECVRIVIEVCRGLECAHGAGVIHRDIKPANIALSDDGVVRIVDFGLAHLVDRDSLSPPRTVLGTLSYMSPEQAQGSEVDHRTDLWSLGVILYEMVAGRLPYLADNPANLIRSILQDAPPRWGDSDSAAAAELSSIVHRCLAKNPSHRFQTAGELRSELEQVALLMDADKQATVRISPVARAVRRFRRRLSLPWLALALVALLGGTGILIKTCGGGLNREDGVVLLPPALVGGTPADQPLADGLINHFVNCLLLQEPRQTGAWVVPVAEVRHRDVVGTEDAQRRLGVSRTVASTLHLQGDMLRLVLVRHDLDPRGWRRLIGSPPSREILGSRGDLVAWQADVQQTLLDLLEWESVSEREADLTLCGTAMPQALYHYLRGLGFLDPYVGPADTEKAVSAFEQAVAADRTFARGHAELARALWRQHQDGQSHTLDEALAASERALALLPDLGTAHFVRGQILAGLDLWEEAASSFRRFLEIVPDHPLAAPALADAYGNLGEHAAAEVVFRRAVERRPGFAAAHNDYGYFLVGRGRYEDAIGSFRNVIELAPAHLPGLSNLGTVYYHLELWNEAEAMFQRCLALEPDAITYQNLGTVYFYERRYLEAARMYEKSIELEPGDYLAYGWAAGCYYWSDTNRVRALNLFGRAATLADSVLGIHQDDRRVQADLANYLAMIGDETRARGLLERAGSVDNQDPDVYFALAACHEFLDARDAALRELERALRGGYSVSLIERYPGMDRLRTDRRYDELLVRVNQAEDR